MTNSSQTNKADNPERLSEAQRAVLQLEEEIFVAVKDRDAKALALVLTDDFVYRSPGHQEVARDDFLKLIASFPIEIISIRGEEMKVNVYGDTAVLTGLQIAKILDGKGEERFSAVMFTDVFVKRNGQWMLSLAHAVDLPQVPSQYLPKK